MAAQGEDADQVARPRPEHRLHVDQAAELLWAGRDPDSARNNLHQAIFAARRALDSIGLDGGRYLELREELILLSPKDPIRIDEVAFEELAAAAREQGEPGAYRSALEGFDAESLRGLEPGAARFPRSAPSCPGGGAHRAVSETPGVAVADSGYWHEQQIDEVVNMGTQVLIPPDAGKRNTPRRGWSGGRYEFGPRKGSRLLPGPLSAATG